MPVTGKNGSALRRPVDAVPVCEPDAAAEAAVVELLFNVFDGIAYMDPDAVHQNMVLASGGFSMEDRSIRMELANYLIGHFAFIYAGLIVNDDFRRTFMEAVSVEIALDSEPEGFVMDVRAQMADQKERDSRGNFVVNLSVYNDAFYRRINSKLSFSFGKVTQFGESIDRFAAQLSDDNRIDIGYCASNFMYAIRAFSKNAAFAGYVKSVVHSVEQTLGVA